MKIKVLPFGQLSEIIKEGYIRMEAEIDLVTLKKELISTYPQLENKPFIFAVNAEVVQGNPLLADGDEVALLPPYAGG